MKPTLVLTLAASLLSLVSVAEEAVAGQAPAPAPAAEVKKPLSAAESIALGEPTEDYAAALKIAKEQKRPLMLIFTASDWCFWCKLMDGNVFSKPEWKTYVKDNLVCVVCDFRNQNKPAAEVVAQNGQLKAQYGVQGFPTYVFINTEDDSIIGDLGAGPKKTPESFLAETKELLVYASEASIDAKAKTLKAPFEAKFAEKARELRKTVNKVLEQKDLKEQRATKAAAAALKQELAKIVEENHFAGLSADKQAEYKQIEKEIEAANKDLSEWIDTKPARNEENNKIYDAKSGKIEELTKKLQAL